LTPLIRYVALQVPGFLIALILLMHARDQEWISVSTVVLVLAILVFKDVILYPFFRRAMQPGHTDMVARLHGERARVVNTLDPEGQVKLKGEIWNAKSIHGEPVEAGSWVRVSGHRGLKLHVQRCHEYD